jgi:hypothetical protein
MEMEVDASFVDDGNYSRADFQTLLHLKVKGE